MAELRTLVTKIRSKNAGPFWLTIDDRDMHGASWAALLGEVEI